jgi:hypothetical protein
MAMETNQAGNYRRRFESSVFGEHTMLPPPEVQQCMKSKEEPSPYPSGQDTSFKNLTPMPFRFTGEAIPTLNERQTSAKAPPLPQCMTTACEVGRESINETDLPMRWYGRSGMFTSSWVAEPKTRISTGLSTSMDHSIVHHTQDQGWSGHLGLTSYNVANLKAATFVGKDPRTETA